ncbi:hypothetical protein [Citricoccus sp. GCM10030269]|uniref:hypothetical protein n=1 Tax=Citricoccus sp. GCM10030269 TaxID=3273388 RepID=UPI003623C6EF
MSTHNFETLRGAVIDASLSNKWANAVQEWQVVGVEEDQRATGICVCGKTGLVYLYTIRNQQTQQALFPIGSSCINHFGIEELNTSVSALYRLLELRAAFADQKHVDLTSEYFSRAMLAYLWENGAFPPNKYNQLNGENDYDFLVDMFNRHREFTKMQKSKVWVLLNRTIKDFVMNDERLGQLVQQPQGDDEV